MPHSRPHSRNSDISSLRAVHIDSIVSIVSIVVQTQAQLVCIMHNISVLIMSDVCVCLCGCVCGCGGGGADELPPTQSPLEEKCGKVWPRSRVEHKKAVCRKR